MAYKSGSSRVPLALASLAHSKISRGDLIDSQHEGKETRRQNFSILDLLHVWPASVVKLHSDRKHFDNPRHKINFLSFRSRSEARVGVDKPALRDSSK